MTTTPRPTEHSNISAPPITAAPTNLFQVLANLPLWGARSGLKMARWSPCDAVLLWSFEAVS
jgi:hypothetical protein